MESYYDTITKDMTNAAIIEMQNKAEKEWNDNFDRRLKESIQFFKQSVQLDRI